MNLLTAIENWVDARAVKQVELRLADISRQVTESVMKEIAEEDDRVERKLDDLRHDFQNLEEKSDDLERGIEELESQIDNDCVQFGTLDERLEDHEPDYDLIAERIETTVQRILSEATFSIDL